MILGMDTETTGLNLHQGDLPFAVSFCDENHRTTFYRWKVNPSSRKVVPPPKDLKDIASMLDKAEAIVFHNAKFDIRALEKVGLLWKEKWWQKTQDTLILSHLFDSTESHELKELASKYLNIPEDDEKAVQKATIAARRQAKTLNWSLAKDVKADMWMPGQIDANDETLDDYAIKDAVRTVYLYLMYKHELGKPERTRLLELYERELSVLYISYHIENRGITIRRNPLYRLRSELRKNSERATAKLLKHVKQHYSLEEFNHRSPKDLAHLLFQRSRLKPVKHTKKGNPSLDRKALEHYWEELPNDSPSWKTIDLLFDIRFNEKSLDYLSQYLKLGRNEEGHITLHPTFNQVGTRTTRFSSTNPNAQNISKGDEKEDRTSLRKVFGPRPGYWWLDIDYSQLELRLFAHTAEEVALMQAFADDQDIHGYVAEALGIDRRTAKVINFGLIYGAQQPRIDSIGGPGTFDRFMRLFPGLPRFQAKAASSIQQYGYVETLFGYRLAVRKDQQGKWRRQGPNYIIQGTAGDIFKEGLRNVWEVLRQPRHRKHDIHPILMVHDELVIEMPDSCMQNYPLFRDITDAMEEPGMRIGCFTPVEVNRVTSAWDNPKKIISKYLCSSSHIAWKTSSKSSLQQRIALSHSESNA